jgi:hypothetical protein
MAYYIHFSQKNSQVILAKIHDSLKTVELCAAALKQCQNPKCFALIPKGIRTRLK